MPYFLSDQTLKLGSQTVLTGPEASHILLSRRIKAGEQILIQDTSGKRYKAEVVSSDKKTVTLEPFDEVVVPPELPSAITLLQSVVSEKALDIIFQKATELGAARIVLFNSANTATKLSADLFKKKHDRWNKILWEAAKQCERGKVPELQYLPSLGDITKLAGEYEQLFVLDASGSKFSILNSQFSTLGLLVGPEGGLTPEEINILKTVKNSELVSISPFILRAETAAIAGLAVLQLNI